jgi:rhodanese-related sulfurtransferase
MADITVEELNQRRTNGENVFLLDVREHFEYDLINLEGELIPLGELQNRLYELESRKNDEIVVYCRTGSRSATAVQLLISNGFTNVRNLTGGIHEWGKKIDPSFPLY